MGGTLRRAENGSKLADNQHRYVTYSTHASIILRVHYRTVTSEKSLGKDSLVFDIIQRDFIT